jgi:phosphoglycerate kinase
MITQPTSLNHMKDSIVLVRVNFDLPKNDSPERIIDAKQTIDQLVDQGNVVVLMSHWGRPKGVDPMLSFSQKIDLISSVLGHDVEFVDQFKTDLQSKVSNLPSKVMLLENLRFDFREQSKDSADRKEFATELAQVADFVVDEAFPVSHRTTATNTEIKELLPWSLGLSHKNEIEQLSSLNSDPRRPFVVLMGGAKLETKIPLIEAMVERADYVLLGGLLSLSFVVASNFLQLRDEVLPIGQSEIDPEHFTFASHMLSSYADKIILPGDFIYGQTDGSIQGLEEGLVMDIGPQSIAEFSQILKQAKTVFWNGPMGYIEEVVFARGTNELAKVITEAENFSVVGGGDTVGSLDSDTQSQFGFVSMGGGATLEFLAKGN